MPNRFLALIQHTKPVIPVVKITDLSHAEPLAEALWEGGLRSIEITLRSPVALSCIERMRRFHSELIVGAGTVLNSAQMHAATNAGAEFLISPGSTQGIVSASRQAEVPFIPGTLTPSDMMHALEANLELVKLFPANAFDTINYLKGLAGPFEKLKFCPTGGLDAKNTRSILELNNVFAAGGTWITPAAALQEKQWHIITSLASQAKTLEINI